LRVVAKATRGFIETHIIGGKSNFENTYAEAALLQSDRGARKDEVRRRRSAA
jgi:hypothetical protein